MMSTDITQVLSKYTSVQPICVFKLMHLLMENSMCENDYSCSLITILSQFEPAVSWHWHPGIWP